MDKTKFNPELPCNHMPFAYIEKKTKIKNKKNEETLAVISFGALETHSHYAPEYGGVAVVHMDPDVFIGVKYIPWDASGRSFEHEMMVQKIRQMSMSNQELADFMHEDGYTLPAVKERIRDEYIKNKLREEALEEKLKKVPEKMIPIEIEEEIIEDVPEEEIKSKFYNGEEIIPLDE